MKIRVFHASIFKRVAHGSICLFLPASAGYGPSTLQIGDGADACVAALAFAFVHPGTGHPYAALNSEIAVGFANLIKEHGKSGSLTSAGNYAACKELGCTCIDLLSAFALAKIMLLVRFFKYREQAEALSREIGQAVPCAAAGLRMAGGNVVEPVGFHASAKQAARFAHLKIQSASILAALARLAPLADDMEVANVLPGMILLFPAMPHASTRRRTYS